MFYKTVFTLLILTVTMVTKSVVAQEVDCPERDPRFGDQFTDCGPLEFRREYDSCCFRGDPHITSFDNADEYRFGKEGNFTAVGVCEEEDGRDILIYVFMEPRLKNRNQFRVIGITIIKAGRVYDYFFRGNRKIFEVNGVPERLPYQDNHAIVLIDPNNEDEVIFRCEHIRIVINCKYHIVCIWLNKDWYLDQGLCGLCGTYNNDRTDDRNCGINCPDDCDDQNDNCDIDEFGNLWKVESNDDDDSSDDSSDDDDDDDSSDDDDDDSSDDDDDDDDDDSSDDDDDDDDDDSSDDDDDDDDDDSSDDDDDDSSDDDDDDSSDDDDDDDDDDSSDDDDDDDDDDSSDDDDDDDDSSDDDDE